MYAECSVISVIFNRPPALANNQSRVLIEAPGGFLVQLSISSANVAIGSVSNFGSQKSISPKMIFANSSYAAL